MKKTKTKTKKACVTGAGENNAQQHGVVYTLTNIVRLCHGTFEPLYFLFFSFSLIWFLFLFYFLDNEEAHDCSHMTHDMTLYHRPRTLRKGLKRMTSRHMSTACWPYGILMEDICVKIEECGSFFFIFFSVLFFFQLIFHFSIFRTLGLGLEVIGHMVTPVIFDGVVITLITELERKK